MVTTRSADKQVNTTSKTESLALRARTDDHTLSTQPSSSEISVSGSSHNKVKITVNVPPPRKRTRLSYDGATDDGNNEAIVGNALPEAVSRQSDTAQSEIPDSQESPVKSNQADNFQEQSGSVPLNQDESVPQTQPGITRKRKIVDTVQPKTAQVITGKPNAAPGSKHKRFGSEEPVDNQPLTESVDLDNEQQTTTDPSLSEDDDGAPEVVTTKGITIGGISGVKRKMRTTRITFRSQEKQSPSKLTVQDKTQAVRPHPGNDELPQSTIDPAPQADLSQDGDSTIALQSEDSNDAAFVTARTTRHVDVFATPQAGTPQTRSPSHDQKRSYTIGAQHDMPTKNLSSNLDMTRPSRSKSGFDASTTSATALPRRPGNTFEKYRQQTLHNRATNSSRRGGHFALQEDWSSKRRKFVVGY